MQDKQVANDVYERCGLKWADFPKPIVPTAHTDEAELFCARQAMAVYGVYPNHPHDRVHDYVPSRIAGAVVARTFDVNRMIEGGADGPATTFEAPRGYRTLATDKAGALLVWEGNRLIVALRGTANWQDWIHNFTGTTIPAADFVVSEAEYGFHKGFCGLASNLLPPVSELINAFVEARGSRNEIELTFCGHSLGGALALHLASMFWSADERHYYDNVRHRFVSMRIAATYTFGAPRLGKGEIWRAISRPHYRLIVRGDPVPRTPFGCAEDFQGAYLEKPAEPAVQPSGTLAKIKKAVSIRMPSTGFSAEAHLIETYIEAIEKKIAAKKT